MRYFTALFCLICTGNLLSQTAPENTSAKASNIEFSSLSDTILFHVKLKGAAYDYDRNNLPFYLVNKNTTSTQIANASLIVNRVSLVDEQYAKVIKHFFGRFLKSDFVLESMYSVARDINHNDHRLIPFRTNESGQIEELLDYEIRWSIGNLPNNAAARGPAGFKSNSVLASGTWYKISVPQTGIYRITKTFLNDMGINTSKLDPRDIRVFGNGGKMLPEINSAARLDDLEENAIKVVGESDGTFDNADYLLFYATGPDEWRDDTSGCLKFEVVKNAYSDSSYYFITTDQGRGKRIGGVPGAGSENVSTSTYDYYNFHEQDVINFGKSGRDFFGEYFDITTAYTFSWDDGFFVKGDTIRAEVSLVASYSDLSEFQATGNGINGKIITGPISGKLYSDYAAPGLSCMKALNTNDALISISVSKLTAKSSGYMDKITVNARRQLNLGARQFNFRDLRVVGSGKVCRYDMSTTLNAQLVLWDVTDPLNPAEQAYLATPSSLSFVADASNLHEYCVAPPSDFMTPAFAGRIANQNLHAVQQADYVIVTHPLFMNEAKRLAQFHATNDNLTYVIATIDQIYNEFSSGRQDATAIRDFIRMLYSRNISNNQMVKYVLLMGDGSYNNRSRNLVNNSNFIPTYQSRNSLSSTISLATDDFYGMMDPGEGYMSEKIGDPDIGVGRFTCRSVNEVKGILNKIEHYGSKDAVFQLAATEPENCNNLNESTMGDWRNWLLFLGDDGDDALHMRDANRLTQAVAAIDTNYNFDKIFLDAFQRFSTPGGPRFPDASTDFVRRLGKGALIFNYTGHGGEVGLTAERMIDIDIINNLDNFNKLPLFITATCEFSRYDDPGRTSAGELCLLNPKGAALALFTTCRVAFSDPNYTLNQVTLQKLFTRLPNGKMPTLGEAIMLTKTDPSIRAMTQYYTNFHLLGDPALRLSYPEDKIITTEINKLAVDGVRKDTLGALARVTVKGKVTDRNGNKLSNFNGVVFPTVFDKEHEVSCLLNTTESAVNRYAVENGLDPGPYKPFVFNLQKNILYRGKVLVTNGDFSFTFIVPKDVSFAAGPGKISYYATNGSLDANGYYNNVVVGGTSNNVLVDPDGPAVSLYLNDKNFISGGITNEKPVLYADLVDSSGINTLGTGIGHDITVILDENSANPIILNDYYEASLNSYQSGRVRYPYSKLSEGEHRLTFKVWDIQNNSSVASTDFVVASSAELALKHVLNYPNPFTTRTKFFFEHNQACNPLKVNIQIYTVSGKLVKTIQKTVLCEGYRPEGIEWDGKDDFGDKLARGVYVYRLSILDVENKKAEKIEKLVILN